MLSISLEHAWRRVPSRLFHHPAGSAQMCTLRRIRISGMHAFLESHTSLWQRLLALLPSPPSCRERSAAKFLLPFCPPCRLRPAARTLGMGEEWGRKCTLIVAHQQRSEKKRQEGVHCPGSSRSESSVKRVEGRDSQEAGRDAEID